MTDPDSHFHSPQEGIGATIREVFAAMALEGLLAHEGRGLYARYSSLSASTVGTAEEAVAYADALIAALNKPKP